MKEFDFLPDEVVLPDLYLAEISTLTLMYKLCCARCASGIIMEFRPPKPYQNTAMSLENAKVTR